MAEDENIDRTPPIALFLSGESFLSAARHLDAAIKDKALRLRHEMPIYYLYSHAFELAFKSFLRAKEVSDSDLRARKKFGHSLLKLHEACLKQGLILDARDGAFMCEIVNMLDGFGQHHEFRYVTTGFKRYPLLSEVSDTCGKLFEAIKLTIVATVSGTLPEPA